MESKNEKTGKTAAAIPEHAKPKLTANEQIAHLKAKGVKFTLHSEDEARKWLADRAYYMDVCSYRCLFEKHFGGKRDGEYANLDFAYLVDLWQIDRKLRRTMLPLTLDIEHFAKTKVVARIAESRGEDGYSIVSDYLNSLDAESKARRKSDIARLEHDPYSGSLERKYKGDRPA